MEGETKLRDIPEPRLYGRLVESQILNARYRMAVLPPFLSTKQNVVLISGDAGMGKSALASSLRGAVEKDGGLFLSGKFDQFLGKPFEPFRQAFTEYADLICERSPARIGQLRADILEAVGRDVGLLTSTIPALTRIIGQQTEAAKVPGSSASHRFRHVFRAFLRAICDENSPLVLQIDDIHWADASSLELLRYMSTSSGDKAFFLVCTFRRENSQESRRPFVEALQDMKMDANLEVTEIRLLPLKLVNVNEILSDTLELTKDETLPLSNVIFRQSRGNSLFVSEVLKLLVDQELVYMQGDKWNWCIDIIQEKLGDTDSIVDLVTNKMKTMPSAAQEVLKAASCLGQIIDESSLFITLQKEPSWVIDSINLSVAAGMLVSTPTVGKYSFRHEKIREAASSLINTEEKPEYFIMPGRRLWKGSDEGTLLSNIFTVVDLLYFGIDLITDTNERYEVAELHRIAGEKATALTAFSQAASYLRRGINLLGKNSWTERYALTLALHDSLAEVETGRVDFDQVKLLIDDVHKNACNIDDKTRSYFTLIHLMASEDYVTEAIAVGIDFLRELGEPFPISTKKSVFVKELVATKWALRGKSNKELLALPKMIDQRKIACANLLSVLFVYCSMQRSPLAPIIALRAIRHTLKNGLFAGSAASFAAYGSIEMGLFENIRLGKRFSDLSHLLLEQDVEGEYLALSSLIVTTGIDIFFKPRVELIERLHYASRTALSRGDIAMAGLNSAAALTFGVYSGMRVSVLDCKVERAFALLDEYNQQDLMSFVLVAQAYVAKISSTTESERPSSLEGPNFMIDRIIREAEERSNDSQVLLLHNVAAILAYMFQDYTAALNSVDNYLIVLAKTNWKCMVGWGCISFYRGVILVALAREYSPGRRQRRLLKQARKILNLIKNLARLCPHHFLHRHTFMDAELKATSRVNKKAVLSLYEVAIQQASQHGYLHEAAMASERASEHCKRVWDVSGCIAFLGRAKDMYEEYGAFANVVRIESLKISFMEETASLTSQALDT